MTWAQKNFVFHIIFILNLSRQWAFFWALVCQVGEGRRGKNEEAEEIHIRPNTLRWTVVFTCQEAGGCTGWPLDESVQMRADLFRHALLYHIHGGTPKVFAVALSRIQTRALLLVVMLPVLQGPLQSGRPVWPAVSLAGVGGLASKTAYNPRPCSPSRECAKQHVCFAHGLPTGEQLQFFAQSKHLNWNLSSQQSSKELHKRNLDEVLAWPPLISPRSPLAHPFHWQLPEKGQWEPWSLSTLLS